MSKYDKGVLENILEAIEDLKELVEEYLEDAEEEEAPKPKFKVGDKVKIKTTLEAGKSYGGEVLFTSDMSNFLGKVAVIKAFRCTCHTDRFTLDVDKGKWSWDATMLEPYVEELKTPSKHELKVGDLAKVVADKCGHRFPLGTVVRITETFPSGYVAKYLDGTNWWYVAKEDVEFYKEEEPKKEFKVGAKVRIKHSIREDDVCFMRTTVVGTMLKYAGKVSNITGVNQFDNGEFRIQLDNTNGYVWGKDQLELL